MGNEKVLTGEAALAAVARRLKEEKPPNEDKATAHGDGREDANNYRGWSSL